MADDTGHDQVVLFGGRDDFVTFDDTWTWDGVSWTQSFPAHSPSSGRFTAMAYDPAIARVVLFVGGVSRSETWTWDGTDWTHLSTAHSPPWRQGEAMAYDAASAELVLFGGGGRKGLLNDTWTFDGTDWAKLSPAHSPSKRDPTAMTYDAKRGEVVLFGGGGKTRLLGDTWTFDGTDWTKQLPTDSPTPRFVASIAYDGESGEVVLFGGVGDSAGGDTWTWDGTNWTRDMSRKHPQGRYDASLTYDAARGQLLLFGGWTRSGRTYSLANDTWARNASGWSLLGLPSMSVSPRSGAPGTVVTVSGTGFGAMEGIRLRFIDSVQGGTVLQSATASGSGAFTVQITIPPDATPGPQRVKANGKKSAAVARRSFTVT